MKKNILLASLILTCLTLEAQWFGTTTTNELTYRDGNVVIGATSLAGSYAPTERVLQLQGVATTLSMFSTTTGGFFQLAYSGTYGTGLYSRAAQISFWTSPTISGGLAERMRIDTDGDVGIGTTSPRGKFDVDGAGDIFLSDDVIAGTTQSLFLPGHIFLSPYNGGNVSYLQARRSNDSGTTSLRLRTSDNGTLTESMHIAGNGNVGIGTIMTNNPNSYKLAVNGKIGAKEVQVENTSSTWADYVFEPDYQLLSLEEVEKFIKVNKHLPEIPSQKDIERNGHKLGEMDVLLLKKIEELTLYLIEAKKENAEIKKAILQLKKQ